MLRSGLAAIALTVPLGCAREQPKPPMPRADARPAVVLAPDGAPPARVEVELARTKQEQARGLMYREKLDDGRGMLFLFPKAHHAQFWMHNTYIPLDMIFIDDDQRVVGVVENASPLTDDPRQVDGLSRYVLEVPGGWAGAHHVGPGTKVAFIDIAP